MPKLSAAQVSAALLAVGATVDQAVTLTAIGGAESQLNSSAVGDVSLENAKWGPSVGVFQIRTLRAETGTGSDRDIQWLQGNIAHQAAAALRISKGGKDYTAWSTYTSGDYQAYLPGGAQSVGWWDKLKGLPGDIAGGLGDAAGGALGAAAAPIVDGFKSIAVQFAFAGLGLALVGAGVVVAFRPQITGAAKTAVKAAL